MVTMHRIPGVQLPDTLRLVSAQGPGQGDDEGPYVLHIVPAPSVPCPGCAQSLKPRVVRQREIADLPVGDHPVLLKVATGTARCRRCRTSVACDLSAELLYGERPLTADLARYLQRHMGKVTLRALSARTGLSQHQIRAAQRSQTTAMTVQVTEADRVEYLGLDEIFILKAKYLVAVDYSAEPRLIRLVRATSSEQGRSNQSIPPDFFAGLPEAKVVSVDLNQEQLRGAKERWPRARIVVDRRHLIEILNRDLIRIVQAIVQSRYSHFPTDQFAKRAVRAFGDGSAPYLSLSHLVLRRARNLTPADTAKWLLVRAESKMGSVLYEAYLWREALHDLYDARLNELGLHGALADWIRRFLAWQKCQSEDICRTSKWAVSNHETQIVNYAYHRLTNAQTELVNAMIRRYLRMGHRYDAPTLMALVNSTHKPSPAQPSPGQQLGPLRWYTRAELPPREVVVRSSTVDDIWLAVPPVPMPLTESFQPEPWPETECLPKPMRRKKSVPRQEVRPQAGGLKPNKLVRPRGVPQAPPELALPLRVWFWLHSKVSPKPRAQRHLTEVLRQAPARDLSAWSLLCAGQLSNELGLQVTPEQLRLWRATVLMLFVQLNPDELSAAERQRQMQLRSLKVSDLQLLPPPLLKEVVDGWVSLSERFATLDPQSREAVDILEHWQSLRYDGRLQAEVRTYRYGTGQDRTIWDKWRQVAVAARIPAEDIGQTMSHLEHLSADEMQHLMQDSRMCWATFLEWSRAQRSGDLGRLPAFGEQERLAWFRHVSSLIRGMTLPV